MDVIRSIAILPMTNYNRYREPSAICNLTSCELETSGQPPWSAAKSAAFQVETFNAKQSARVFEWNHWMLFHWIRIYSIGLVEGHSTFDFFGKQLSTSEAVQRFAPFLHTIFSEIRSEHNLVYRLLDGLLKSALISRCGSPHCGN